MKDSKDQILLKKGDNYFDSGDLEKAELCYLKAIEITPNLFSAHFSLGALYYESERYDKSLHHSETAIKLDPENHLVLFNIGLVLNMTSRDEEAVIKYKKAVEINPTYGLGYFALANTLFHMERYEEAQSNYKEAVKNKIIYDNVWFSWGETLFILGEYSLALQCFETFLAITNSLDDSKITVSRDIPKYDQYYAIGKTEFYLGNNENAEKFLKYTLAEKPDHFEAYLFLMILAKRGGDEKSVDQYRYKILGESQDSTYYSYDLYSCPDSPAFFLNKTIKNFWDEDEDGSEDIKVWSDLYTSSEEDTDQLLVYCHSCGSFHHKDEIKYEMGLPAVLYSSELPSFDNFDSLSIDDYFKALEQIWSKNIEKELRTRLMWILNHQMRGGYNPEDLHPERLSNIRSLYDILKDEGDSLLLAEVCRELEDFTQSIEILDRLLEDPDFSQIDHASRVKVCAQDRISTPFSIVEESSKENKLDFPYEECVKNGFFIFPKIEDVFAFSDDEKEKEYKPFLSVDLSKSDEDLDGWVTFTYEPENFIHRYGRLFTDEEWEYFQELDGDWKDELVWFWSFKSWSLPKDPDDLSDYYRILFTLYHKADYERVDFKPHESYVSFLEYHWKEEFKLNKWPEILNGISGWSEEEKKWFEERELYYLWKDIFDDWMSNGNDIKNASDLRRIIKEDIQKDNIDEQDRKDAFSGLYYLDRDPNWFQGHNKTPKNSEGDSYMFVGQIWSDYVNAYGSKLLYLFYDKKDNRQFEDYDYD